MVARTGLRPGDIVRGVNGQGTETVAALAAALGRTRQWELLVERDGQQAVIRFAL